jgi:hypothetical protein
MLSPRALPLFDDHHDRAMAIINAQREYLTALTLPDAATLARHRWELVRVLVEFELFKHREIFDPLIRHGDQQTAARARIMKQECTALGADIRAFVTQWSNGSVEERWPEFRLAKLALFDRIERDLADQRRGLVLLAAAPPRSAGAAPVTAGGAIRSTAAARPLVSTYADRR